MRSTKLWIENAYLNTQNQNYFIYLFICLCFFFFFVSIEFDVYERTHNFTYNASSSAEEDK